MVGDQQVGQNLSIGSGCDHKAIIEHELLHALGFYHEQSRTDRDDYVTIHWDEILQGMYAAVVFWAFWDHLWETQADSVGTGIPAFPVERRAVRK